MDISGEWINVLWNVQTMEHCPAIFEMDKCNYMIHDLEWILSIKLKHYGLFCFILAVLEFEFRASYLLGRNSII
jgi:hypothetical protein